MISQLSNRLRALIIVGAVLAVALSSILLPTQAHALSWSQVNSDGFGSSGNWGTLVLHIFNNQIYAGVGNDAGAPIYRSSDGTTWNQVEDDGFGGEGERVGGCVIFKKKYQV